ncbi:MAG TPA: hypothetical protein PLF40_25670 [Kofleriaceae bacterium]|nr:hypothetical protein [Kofleriaceae bacterium]
MTARQASPESSLADFVVWDAAPHHMFPNGGHAYAADLGAVTALAAALERDLADALHVPVAAATAWTAAREALDAASDAGPSGVTQLATMPLRMANVRAFIAAHAATLDAVLQHPRVTANTRAYAEHRLAELTEQSADLVLLDDAQAQVARVTAANYRANIELDGLILDGLEAASMVDLDALDDDEGTPCVDVDVAQLVLLAAHCCITPDAAPIVVDDWLHNVARVPLTLERAADDDAEPTASPAAPTHIIVRPFVYAESLLSFAYADVRKLAGAATIAPAGAVIFVEVPAQEAECNHDHGDCGHAH